MLQINNYTAYFSKQHQFDGLKLMFYHLKTTTTKLFSKKKKYNKYDINFYPF